MREFLSAAGLIAAAALIIGPAGPVLAAEIHPAPTLSDRTDVVQGVLANGMRYAVMSNPAPKGGLSLRLMINAGRWDETDPEIGVAHLVEHLAFRATRRFAEGELDAAFSRAGLAWGRDHNAYTALRATVYQVDLPDAHSAFVDQSLAWMRDVGDGVDIRADYVTREIGVVRSEARETSVEALTEQARILFEAPELQSSQRLPAGAAPAASTDLATVKGFYARWYRPDNAMIIAVGDLPAAEMVAKIHAAFDTWSANGPPPARRATTPPVAAGPARIQALTNPISREVRVCRVVPAGPDADTPEGYAEAVRRQVWVQTFNKRLAAQWEGMDDIASMYIGQDIEPGESVRTCLAAMLDKDGWEKALAFGRTELIRFGRDGPTEEELYSAITLARTEIAVDLGRDNSIDSATIADGLAEARVARGPWLDARHALKAFDLAAEALKPADLRAQFNRDWAGRGEAISVSGPAPPPTDALLTAWNAAGKSQPPAYVPPAAIKWAYPAAERAGPIARRQTVAQPGFTRVTFKNGVVLNLKSLPAEKNRVSISVAVGRGRQGIAARDQVKALIAGLILHPGGLGQHGVAAIDDYFGESLAEFQLVVGGYAFHINKSVTTDSVDDWLVLLAAYFKDPGFRPSLDARIPAAIEAATSSIQAEPLAAIFMALDDALLPPEQRQPSLTELQKLRTADLKGMLGPVLTRDAIEITIVGDLDEAGAIEWVGRTFGVLPTRDPLRPIAADANFRRFPAHPPAELRTQHTAGDGRSAVALVWPLWFAEPARRREEYAVHLLAEIFSTRLLTEVRERLGLTYTPEVDADTPDELGQGLLVTMVECAPSDETRVRTEVAEVAAQLAAGEITPEMLQSAREPMLAEFRKRRGDIEWWMGALVGSSRPTNGLQDQLNFERDISAVTLEDVRQAAATWLSRPPIVAVAEPASRKVAAQ